MKSLSKKYLVISVGKVNISAVQTELPEKYSRFTDDYNQFEHMEDLPSFYDWEREKREAVQYFFESDTDDLVWDSFKFKFEGNTRYLYIVQNQKNKEVLFDIISNTNVDLKIRLLALLYLGRWNEKTDELNKYKKQMAAELKKEFESKELVILNNFDLRAYLTGIYLILSDFVEKDKGIPYFVSKAVIIRGEGDALANTDGFFADVTLFTLIHELTHEMFPKPSFKDFKVADMVDELVSYVTPNIFLSVIIKLSVEAYSQKEGFFTIHQKENGLIDYVKMGKKFHALYNLFSEKFEDYKLEQKDYHGAAIAYVDLLFNAHNNIGKQVDWQILLESINTISSKDLNQRSVFIDVINSYVKKSVDKGLLTQEDAENLIREMEKMQAWTLLSDNILELLENGPFNILELLANKEGLDAASYKNKVLSEPTKLKENLAKISQAFQLKMQLSKKDLIALLVIDIVQNVEYDQLVDNFNGVMNGIVDVINKTREELNFDLNRQSYDRSDYMKLAAFVANNYTVAEGAEGTVINDSIAYISNNLAQLSFVTKLINKVFGIKDLTKIFDSKKLLVATSKQQEETLKQILKDNNIEAVEVVSMEIITSPVNDKRSDI